MACAKSCSVWMFRRSPDGGPAEADGLRHAEPPRLWATRGDAVMPGGVRRPGRALGLPVPGLSAEQESAWSPLYGRPHGGPSLDTHIRPGQGDLMDEEPYTDDLTERWEQAKRNLDDMFFLHPRLALNHVTRTIESWDALMAGFYGPDDPDDITVPGDE